MDTKKMMDMALELANLKEMPGDCGIVVPGSNIKKVLMGVDMDTAELLLAKELGNEIFFAVITGYGRAMSEVGAIMIVGGNIRHHTRTMTTAISLLRNRGEIEQAVTLGAALMLIAFCVQMIADILRRRERRADENF